MQHLTCPICGGRVWFQNLSCANGHQLVFDPESGAFAPTGAPCANREVIGCNWLVRDEPPLTGLCRSCAMSGTIPALTVPANQSLLARSEAAKRWVLANLARWQWFTDADTGPRPVFRMLSEWLDGQTEARVMMGHASGTITINVVEADDLIRQRRQSELGEHYRSMVGHIRHELAHFLFERLAHHPAFLPEFRAIFGDERRDYAEALAAHYAAPQDPGETHITQYATMHPHEDWAETAAHLLHLVDMTDSFIAAGVSAPDVPGGGYDPYADRDPARLLNAAMAVALAVNDINRALDNPDLYPFVLTGPIREKLVFAHRWLSTGATAISMDPPSA